MHEEELPSWVTWLLDGAEEVTDAAVETMTVRVTNKDILTVLDVQPDITYGGWNNATQGSALLTPGHN
jgi:hypothetical protein